MRKLLSLCVCLLVLLSFLSIFPFRFNLLPIANASTAPTTMLQGYSYYKQVNITGATGASANYTVLITVCNGSTADSGNVVYENNRCNFSDFRDIRFADTNANLEYAWNQSLNSGVNVTVWVNVGATLASNQSVWMYYGNPSASAYWDFDNTFVFGDPFDNSAVNTSRWISNDTGIAYTINAATHFLNFTSPYVGSNFNAPYGLHSKTFTFPSGWQIQDAYNNSRGYMTFLSAITANLFAGGLDVWNGTGTLPSRDAVVSQQPYHPSSSNSYSGYDSYVSGNETYHDYYYYSQTLAWNITKTTANVYSESNNDTSPSQAWPTTATNATFTPNQILLRCVEVTGHTFGQCGVYAFIVRQYVSPEPSINAWGPETSTTVTYQAVTGTLTSPNAISMVTPNGAGGSTQLTGYPNSTNWQCASTNDSSTSYVRSSTSSTTALTDLYAVNSNNVPSGSTVTSVEVHTVDLSYYSSYPATFINVLYDGTNLLNGTSFTESSAWVDHAYMFTGVTYAMLANMQIGVTISSGTNAGIYYQGRCTQVYAIINYQPPTTATNVSAIQDFYINSTWASQAATYNFSLSDSNTLANATLTANFTGSFLQSTISLSGVTAWANFSVTNPSLTGVVAFQLDIYDSYNYTTSGLRYAKIYSYNSTAGAWNTPYLDLGTTLENIEGANDWGTVDPYSKVVLSQADISSLSTYIDNLAIIPANQTFTYADNTTATGWTNSGQSLRQHYFYMSLYCMVGFNALVGKLNFKYDRHNEGFQNQLLGQQTKHVHHHNGD